MRVPRADHMVYHAANVMTFKGFYIWAFMKFLLILLGLLDIYFQSLCHNYQPLPAAWMSPIFCTWDFCTNPCPWSLVMLQLREDDQPADAAGENLWMPRFYSWVTQAWLEDWGWLPQGETFHLKAWPGTNCQLSPPKSKWWTRIDEKLMLFPQEERWLRVS